MKLLIFRIIRQKVAVLLLLCICQLQAHSAGGAGDTHLTAPDGSSVDIYRDSFGVPYITGESEIGVFFGQGYATAQDRLFQMEQFRLLTQGRSAEIQGDDYIETDQWFRTIFYTEEERKQQFLAMPSELQTVFESYRDGINAYLDSMTADPETFMPMDLVLLLSQGKQIEPWTVTTSIAILQYAMRIFGQEGGEELARALELQTYGKEWFDKHRPINDPHVYTTIPDSEVNTAAPKPATQTWKYSGMIVQSEVVTSVTEKEKRILKKIDALGLPCKFGSFAVLISGEKSSTGNVMLLGAPQMGDIKQDEVSIVNEVELFCPDLHVGGMIIAGIPGVIVGHNENFAWSLTSGWSDNTDVYIETTQDASLNKYLYNDEWVNFEAIEDTIYSSGEIIPFTHYRTVHGPVFAYDLENRQAFSAKMTFWNKELDSLHGLYTVWKAENLQQFEVGAAMIPVTFNLFYAGKDQTIKMWHIGRYQDRSDGVDPRLPHLGDGSEEWGGLIDFSDQPSVENPSQRYLVNWNNKPVSWWNNGDNIPWARNNDIDELNKAERVLLIENFVGPITSFTYENLKDVPRQIDDHGTYQQAISLSTVDIIDENIIPPGQSGFRDIFGNPSPHVDDQWPLHENWKFKDMIFGKYSPSSKRIEMTIPTVYKLVQNYPNPFNSETTIQYELSQNAHVAITIYNILGQEIKNLVNDEKPSGIYSVQWDGTDNKGVDVTSGMYFYTMKTNRGHLQLYKMMILK